MIPEEWLGDRVDVAEVEADLAGSGATDVWLCQWRAFLDHLGPGDELRAYWGAEAAAAAAASVPAGDRIAGFEQVRDRAALAHLGWADADAGRDWRWGWAAVRSGRVVDWVEAPP